ncbi:MAG: hypothetical protein Q9186_004405 [Xanthomendoza sp. 1 TL-2023]
MASHSLAIAKASLAAGLMRPDPKPVAKADIADFHRLLDALLAQCTAANIQEWLLKNTAPSAVKTGAVGKYLVALAATLPTSVDKNGISHINSSKKPSTRRQLHILYLLHDLLHHTKFHSASLADSSSLRQTLEPYIAQLVALAATQNLAKYPQHFSKLSELINVWKEGDCFPPVVITGLQKTLTDASDNSVSFTRATLPLDGWLATVEVGTGESQREAPFIMPSSHGDLSVPYYDLPAGNLMPCIVPNSSAPISSLMVKPLQLRAGPADETLARAMKAFLRDAEAIYGLNMPEQEYDKFEINELGQTILLNDNPEGILASEGYYGWSKAFCQRMKLRSSGELQAISPQHHGVKSLRKRRRYSSSQSSRSRSPSIANSRSTSPGIEPGRMRRRSSASDSRSRSHSRLRRFDEDRYSRTKPLVRAASSRSRSISYSPPDVAAPQTRGEPLEHLSTNGPPQDRFSQAVPPPPAFPQQFLGPGQLPIPPPPPPNYSGPWPPPPPPPPPAPSLSVDSLAHQKSLQMPLLPTYASSPPPPPLPRQPSIQFATSGYQGGSDGFNQHTFQAGQSHMTAGRGRGHRGHWL